MSALRKLAIGAIAAGLVAAAAALRAQEAPSAYPKERVKALMGLVEAMRQKKFKRDVRVAAQSPEDFRKFAEREIDKELPPAKAAALGKALHAFGLLPAGFDLRGGLVDLVVSQAAAYYNPDTGTFYVVMADMAKDQLEAIMLHELVHALQDQYFDLGPKMKAVADTGDEDAGAALKFLVEGEASYLMTKYELRTSQGVDLDALPPATQEALFGQIRDLTRAQIAAQAEQMRKTLGDKAKVLTKAMAALEKMPDYLFWSLHAPYFRGQWTVFKLQQGGWPAVDEVYETLPTSTEQMLHPEKLAAAGRDEPSAVALPVDAIGAALGPEWTRVHEGSLGEFGMLLLLEDAGAAGGWDGDRYACWEGPGGALALVWKSFWDSAGDAREFAEKLTPAGFDLVECGLGPQALALKGVPEALRAKVAAAVAPPAPPR